MKFVTIIGFIVTFLLSSSLWADDAAELAKTEKPRPAAGTTVYDSEAISELYTKYKKENEKNRYDDEALIGDMETFVLDDMEVFADDLISERELQERLNMRPQNRINRIARVNPDAAAEIRYARRSDEAFFSNESLPRITGGDPGYTADMSVGQIGAALTKIGKLFGGKKDDDENVR